ncbi:response regulator [Halobacteriovorax sp. HLS]|uniref:response regulator n=1 Tax=Halobacteriovorax sp. HLS TaxID=2234000 RepID=UPI000FD7FA5F|nr:response regulator [Halobacteriovorax sp. HLS]
MAQTNFLIIDDKSFYFSMLKDHLSMLGYKGEFRHCSGALEAITFLEQFKREGKYIDIIICDLQMPEYSGVDFVKAIKKSKHFNNIPVLMFTTESEKMDILEAIKHGASDYIYKPWNEEELDIKIKRLLKS